MSADHFYNILDRVVLKEGMRVKSCLDMRDTMTLSNGYDLDWYTGIILEIDESYDYEDEDVYRVTIKRDDNEGWNIILDEDNLEYIMIYVNDWDE